MFVELSGTFLAACIHALDQCKRLPDSARDTKCYSCNKIRICARMASIGPCSGKEDGFVLSKSIAKIYRTKAECDEKGNWYRLYV